MCNRNGKLVGVFILLTTLKFSGSADITAIYRLEGNVLEPLSWEIINGSYRFSEGEIYIRTSALGKDITDYNGESQTIYPDGPNFPSCYERSCHWIRDNWVVASNESNLEEYYELSNTLKYHGEYFEPSSDRGCLNGGKFNIYQEKCICPHAFVGEKCEYGCTNGGSLDKDNKTCICPEPFVGKRCEYGAFFCGGYNTSFNNGIFLKAEPKYIKSITSPNYPGMYYHNINWQYRLDTYPGSHVTLVFETFDLASPHENTYDFVKVYDGPDSSADLIGTFSYGSFPPPMTSSGNTMYVQFQSDGAKAEQGFYARYYDNPHHSGKIFRLDGGSGTMKSPVFTPASEQICIGVMYYVTKRDQIKLQITLEKQGGSHEDFDIWNITQSNMWKYQSFIANLNQEDMHKEMRIVIFGEKFTADSEVFIRLIQECNPYNIERVIKVTNTCIPINFHNRTEERNSSNCINGGKLLPDSGKCVCPVGFTGDSCEVGCGPNRYGEDCGGECSWHESGCRGLVMCKEGFACDCAPGFKGRLCNNNCDFGEYGAGCKQKCAQCGGDGSCDPYTGVCNFGCMEGYFPPLCYYKYKHVSAPPTISSSTFSTLSIETHFDQAVGYGNPKYFEIQYKKEGEKDWSMNGAQLIPTQGKSMIKDITGLSIGCLYYVRTVLIDEDLSSYQGEDIPYTTALTKCIVPDSINYRIQCQSLSQNGFEISWQYDPEMTTACPILKYEVYIRGKWSWFLYWNGTENTAKISNLYPGKEYFVKVRGVTVGGPARYSDSLRIVTRDSIPGRVSNIMTTATGPEEIHISWKPPTISAGYIKYYSVKWTCNKLLGCPEENCEYISGQTRVMYPEVLIIGLLPHSQYLVSISATSGSEGPAAFTRVATNSTVPDIAPGFVSHPVIKRSISSFTARWKEPNNCTLINGYFSHYQYELFESSTNHQIFFDNSVVEGSTRNTSVTFTGLKEFTEYKVKVYLVTSGGYNPDSYLIIEAGTKRRVPDAVQHLTVYQKGRKMIGLRWANPKVLYGSLNSFKITYWMVGSSHNTSVSIKPEKCVAWPHLFCYSILSLTPEMQYIATVSARNTEIAEDGDFASIIAVTKEEAPKSPVDLEILEQSESSIKIQWSLPYVLNGVLRKFYLDVKQVDAFDAENCCIEFPVEILSARVEQPYYKHEFVDLSPASTYIISVSAKTTTMGPAAIITGYTKPQAPSMEDTVDVLPESFLDSTVTVKLYPINQHAKLIKIYLLLVFPQNDSTFISQCRQPQVKVKYLANELKNISDEPFYIAGEFQQSELSGGLEVLLGTGHPLVEGKLVRFQDPHFKKGGQYRLAFVIVLQYLGIYSTAHTFTPIIIVN